MKQCLALVGVVFLTGAVLHVKPPPATTSRSHFTSPELTCASMDLPHPATNSGFLDNINLSLDAPVEIFAPNPNDAGLNLQRDLPPGGSYKLQPRPGHITKSGLTVVDQKLNYELLHSEGFALKLNLAPAYPYPEAPIPTRLDPGFGISIKF